jgi:hypothetical protein
MFADDVTLADVALNLAQMLYCSSSNQYIQNPHFALPSILGILDSASLESTTPILCENSTQVSHIQASKT